MSLSTFDTFKHLKPSSAVEISTAELRRLQMTLVEIVKDVIQVCSKHGIVYMLGGGSALGARRHAGFIPWDDDVDLNFPRRDFDRFIDVFTKECGDKYWIQSPAGTVNYGFGMGRLRLKGTSVRTREDYASGEQNCGAFVDLFIIENTFDNALLRGLHGFGSMVLGFLYSCRKLFNERATTVAWMRESHAFKGAVRFKYVAGFFLSVFSLNKWMRVWDRWNRLCGNPSSRYVTIPVGRRHFWGELGLRAGLCEVKTTVWEGLSAHVPRNLDDYLYRLYGSDYMVPPPVEKRETHAFFPPFTLGSPTGGATA